MQHTQVTNRMENGIGENLDLILHAHQNMNKYLTAFVEHVS